MKKIFEITLGIITSIGGFLEIGSVGTAALAGAVFGYQLTWVVALGTVCLMFLVEQSGRFSAVSKHTISGAMRERFGFAYFAVPLVAVTLVCVLVLAAEIGGVCLALQLLSGVRFQWWAVPVGLVVWLLLWKGSFGLIEKGLGFLGLVTVAFLVGALRLHPSLPDVGAALLPTLPSHDRAQYWFTAVSILGASISPYLFYFYSSGAIEEKWDESYLPVNRVVAALGMTFGGVLSVAVLVLAALVFLPRGIQVDKYEQVALLLVPPLGRSGFFLFAVALGIACLGAALEIALSVAYLVAQGLGWNWGKEHRPREAARFSVVYSLALIIGALLVFTGIDPLKLTLVTMALTAVVLPLVVVPFIVLMNDERYVGDHKNGRISNIVVVLIIGMAFVLALVAIPLQIMGG